MRIRKFIGWITAGILGAALGFGLARNQDGYNIFTNIGVFCIWLYLYSKEDELKNKQ